MQWQKYNAYRNAKNCHNIWTLLSVACVADQCETCERMLIFMLDGFRIAVVLLLNYFLVEFRGSDLVCIHGLFWLPF